MIIFGTRRVLLKQSAADNLICPHCENKGTTSFGVYSKHFHLFWIPFIPIGKRGISGCSHCKKADYVEDMGSEAKEEYKYLKDQTTTPFWQFSGLILFVFLITWGYYTSKQDDKKELGYINNPQIGDTYTYKADTREYSTFRIIDIANGSLTISYNDYAINKFTKVNEIDLDENYSEELYKIGMEDLKALYQDKTIRDISIVE